MAYKTININTLNERLYGIFDRARTYPFCGQEELLEFVESEICAYAIRINASDADYKKGDSRALSCEKEPLDGSGAWHCPRCDAALDEEEDFEKCGCCGQCLSWEGLLPFC